MTSLSLARIPVFAGLVVLLGLAGKLDIVGFSVPITVQSLGVMLAGLMLPPVEAFLALALFDAMVAIGLPVLAGGRGGLGIFSGPSAGYVIGFPFAAFAVSAIFAVVGPAAARAFHSKSVGEDLDKLRRANFGQYGAAFFASVLGGVVVLYAFGVTIGAQVTDTPFATALDAAWIFIPGDIAKAVVASVVAVTALRALPIPERARRATGALGG